MGYVLTALRASGVRLSSKQSVLLYSQIGQSPDAAEQRQRNRKKEKSNPVALRRRSQILDHVPPGLRPSEMIEWNIQSRAHACKACATAFTDGQSYHTVLLEERAGFERQDLCPACWKARTTQVEAPVFLSHWMGTYESPPATPPDAIQKETAETLLRKLMEPREDRHVAACYILAVMLERKRILRVKAQLYENGRRIFLYEQPKTGDLFSIADPDLQLDQLEAVQRDVASLLEHGPDGAIVPGEIPSPAETSVSAPPVTDSTALIPTTSD